MSSIYMYSEIWIRNNRPTPFALVVILVILAFISWIIIASIQNSQASKKKDTFIPISIYQT
jgi:hypothetical protein